MPRPPPVKLRGVDMVSNEELMAKLREKYGNPHVTPPYGVSEIVTSHPARRANSTVDIVEGGPTYFVEAPSRGGPTPAQGYCYSNSKLEHIFL